MKQYISYILSSVIVFFIVGCAASQKQIESSQVHKKPSHKKEKNDYIEYDPSVPSKSLSSYDANDKDDPINREIEYEKDVKSWENGDDTCSKLLSEGQKSACYDSIYRNGR